MCKAKTWSLREFQRVLKENNYQHIGTRGDHYKYKSPDGRVLVINPKCNKMVARRLIKEYGLVV